MRTLIPATPGGTRTAAGGRLGVLRDTSDFFFYSKFLFLEIHQPEGIRRRAMDFYINGFFEGGMFFFQL